MTIQQLHNFKLEQKFLKVSKNDTHYRWVGKKYDVDIHYHSSNFYQPDFFKLQVTDKNGNCVWNDGSLLFHGDFMAQPFISETYDSMVLPLVHDTSDSESMQVILVDLKKSSYKPITPKGFYPFTGHFQSFNSIFWGEKSGVIGYNLDNNKTFILHELLSPIVSEMYAWCTSPVNNNMLIVSKESERNIILFNVQQGVITGKETISFNSADNLVVTCHPEHNTNGVLLHVQYSKKTESEILQFQSSDFYQIIF